MSPRRGYRRLTAGELRARGLSQTSESYLVEATGAVISRRQYDNRRYQDFGWRSRDDFERRFTSGHSEMAGYRRWREAAIRSGVSHADVDRPDSIFNALFLDARADGFDKGRKRRGPRSPIAKLLVYVGLRDPDAKYPVGGS